MNVIECPNVWDGSGFDSVFLGGGISNCPDWQKDMIKLLSKTELVLLNPRRASFDVSKKSETIFQIEWEFEHLKYADARLFWFPKETLCPITLLELGKFIAGDALLFVGIHPEYKRKLDVETQLKLARPKDCDVYYSLEDLAEVVINWSENLQLLESVMDKELRNFFLSYFAYFAVMFGFIIAYEAWKAHQEAECYERMTGKKVTAWDAYFLDLRIEVTPK